MTFNKALTFAAAAAIAVLPMTAQASSLTNVISSSTSTFSGHVNSHTTSWDEYRGVQVNVSETSSHETGLGADLTGIGAADGIGGNANLYAQHSQSFSAQGSIVFFKGGDTSDTRMSGHLNQIVTSFTTGVQTSFVP